MDLNIQEAAVPASVAETVRRAGTGGALHWCGPIELGATAPRIALIGTRTPGPDSAAAIEALAGVLAEGGATIVSGAARGTDMAAHCGALDRGGRTIACIPSGLEALKPDNWRKDFMPHFNSERLLLISPFPRRQPITKQTPIIRNRLIAAFAEAIILGEASLQSGTYSCASFAVGMGVPIFFLKLPAMGDAPLEFVHRRLEKKGATAFALDDAFGPELPRAVLDAAARFRQDNLIADEAQLRLFHETDSQNQSG